VLPSSRSLLCQSGHPSGLFGWFSANLPPDSRMPLLSTAGASSTKATCRDARRSMYAHMLQAYSERVLRFCRKPNEIFGEGESGQIRLWRTRVGEQQTAWCEHVLNIVTPTLQNHRRNARSSNGTSSQHTHFDRSCFLVVHLVYFSQQCVVIYATCSDVKQMAK